MNNESLAMPDSSFKTIEPTTEDVLKVLSQFNTPKDMIEYTAFLARTNAYVTANPEPYPD